MADRRFFFHPEAEREFEEAASWYDERSPGLGVEFVASVRSKVEQILESAGTMATCQRYAASPRKSFPVCDCLQSVAQRENRDSSRCAFASSSNVLGKALNDIRWS